MKTPLTYGFVMAIAGVLLTFVMFFAGYHDSAEKMQSAVGQTVGMVGPLVIGVICLLLAMREKRAATPAETPWGYGSAFGTGVMTALFGSLIGVVFAYVYFAYLNPHMGEVVYQMQVAKMEAKGMSQDRIDQAESVMRKMLSPAMMTAFQCVSGFVWGVLVSLVVAIFVRDRPAAPLTADTPPALG